MLTVPPPQPRASGRLTWPGPCFSRSRCPGAGPLGCAGHCRSTHASWTSVSACPACAGSAWPLPHYCQYPAHWPCLGTLTGLPNLRLVSCILHGSHPCCSHGQGHHLGFFCGDPSGALPQSHEPTHQQDHGVPHHSPAPHHSPPSGAWTPASAPRHAAAPGALRLPALPPWGHLPGLGLGWNLHLQLPSWQGGHRL